MALNIIGVFKYIDYEGFFFITLQLWRKTNSRNLKAMAFGSSANVK